MNVRVFVVPRKRVYFLICLGVFFFAMPPFHDFLDGTGETTERHNRIFNSMPIVQQWGMMILFAVSYMVIRSTRLDMLEIETKSSLVEPDQREQA